MKADYTHITVLLDRTGSMESIRDDTIGGFNAFLAKQKAEPGGATLTLVQFDSQDPYEVLHRFWPIGKVPELTRETYLPRATTPLLDAMGRAINDLEHSLAKLKAKDRPAKVIMAIVTDGQENASREFRKDQIEKMIREKTAKHSWQFVFLSADLAAIGDAWASASRETKCCCSREVLRATRGHGRRSQIGVPTTGRRGGRGWGLTNLTGSTPTIRGPRRLDGGRPSVLHSWLSARPTRARRPG